MKHENFETPDTDQAGALALRDELARDVNEVMEAQGLSRAELARRVGVAQGTFSQWLSGKYAGRYENINEKVSIWLRDRGDIEAMANSLPASPGYLELEFSGQVMATMSMAQLLPTMVMVTAEAGIGKTTAAKRYAQMRANTYLVTMSPHCRTIHNMLTEIAAGIGIEERSSNRLVRSIGKRLERMGDGTLLIVDEAQNLSDDGINQLRHFVDNFGCGIALLGNRETYARFSRWGQGDKYGQLRRRIFKRVRRDKARLEDIAAFIAAWGVSERGQVEFLTGVGLKAGALGQIDMTIRLARMAAEGAGRPMSLADLKAAWSNRDVEGA